MIHGFELFFSLFNNLAIFIALITVYGYLYNQLNKIIWFRRQIMVGLSFGVFAVGCMHAKIPVFEGVIVDQRNAIIVLSGAFGGPLSAVISAILTGSYRVYLGGGGAFAGVVGVSLSATAGIILNKYPSSFGSIQKATLSSLFATIVILPGFLFVKDIQTGWGLMKAMALPYGFAIYCGILLVGLLLRREEARYFAEQSFKESEEKYRGLVEGTEDLIAYTDKDGNFTFVNQVAEKILGIAPDECIGKSLFQFLHPEDRALMINKFQESVKQGKNQVKLENRLVNAKTGKIHTVLWSSTLHLNKTGTLIAAGSIARDITEIYIRDQKIHENEKQLKNITENIAEVVFQFEVTSGQVYTFKYVSPKLFDIFGIEISQESLFETFIQHLPPEDQDKFKNSIQDAIINNRSWYYEGKFIKPTGEEIWFSASAGSQRNQKTSVFNGVLMDLTKRHEMEAALRITQFSFDKAAIGIYQIAADGKILNMNKHAAQSIGYDSDEISNMFIFDIDPNSTHENWEKYWQSFCEGGGGKIETIHQRQDGKKFPVEITFNIIEYDSEKYSISFVQDISERKQAETDLKNLRNYLSNIIDSMPSLIVGVDNHGLVTQWNKTVEKTTGILAKNARGKIFSDIMPQMASENDKIVESIQSREVKQDLKKRTITKDGVLYEDVTIYPLTSNGVQGVVIRIDDVTEKVRFEEMMIQSEKMLSVGGLAAGMAHEINNPLAGMMQTATVLKSRLEGIDVPANLRVADEIGIPMEKIHSFMQKRGILRMADTINESGGRLTEIVDNMLSFARKSDATVSSQDLIQLMDQILELATTDYNLKKHYDFKNIKIIKEYEENLPLVPCEGAKIQQVLLNILRNGAQAMQEEYDAMETKSCFTIRFSIEHASNMFKIEIEDNGPGMDKSIQKRVFEPFYTTKKPGEGTGLGLSVSYFIITENHGGTMDVVSTPGSGTNFIIRLPLEHQNIA